MSKSTHQRKSRIESARPNRAADKALPLRRTWPVSLCVGLALGSIVFSGEALAGGPTGGVVVGGSGSITQSGNSTVINQASQKLALNWQTFNVGANESVLFNQPSRSAVALNRILDQNPSQIFGRINSNGQIFLINTHGIIFGATAQMNVGGLLASTLDLTPNDFLAGHYNLNASGAGAGIVNHGLIQAASGGSVALVGGSVLNDGLIFANYGKINLDGADHAVLDFDGNGLINIQITGELKQRLDQREAAVTNKGTLRAEDGTVVLQASATKDLFTNLVNNTGIVDASGISTDGGVVRLVANGGNVESSGSINVSGVHGGSAQLLSDKNVGVTGGSIDASGALGGGSIRVGGGWQGGEGLQTAAAAYVAPDAVLRADATQRGDGGSVVVWGNDANNFYGSISARGGALGGSGGRVETSSHYGLNVHGGVGAAAPQGNAGTWLLDPYDVTISGGADANTGTAPNYTASGTGSVVNAGGIGTALTGGTNVFVFTNTASNGAETGNITLSAPIAAAGAGSLYLEAVGSILLDSTITGKNAGSPLNVFLWANYGGAAAGTSYSSNAACATCQVVIGNSASAGITTYGGNVDIRTGDGTYAGGGLQLGTSGTITGSINAGSGSLSATTTGISQQATGASTILAGTANLDGGAGAISLTNTGNNFSGAVSLHNSGNNAVTLNNGSNALQLGTSSLGSGTLTVTAGSITQNGAITQASAAGAASFNASNAITLNNAGNSFTGAVGLTGSNLSLVNNTATVLGTTTATGTLSVASNGVLSQTGVLSATGNATFTQNSTAAAATQDIDLGSQNNNFQNGVTFAAGAGAGINNLSLKNTYASPGTLTLPASIAGNLTLNYTTASLTAPAASVGGALDLTAAGGIRISGNVTSTGAQAYHSAVTLGANATLATTNGNVSFDSTVDNATTTARNLTVNAGSGAVTFGGAVGGNVTNGALGALAVNSTGVTGFNAAVKAASLITNTGGSTVLGGDITTSGAQTYNDAVTLGSDLTLSTTNNSVSFAGTVDNASTTARNLTVNAGSGAVTFGGVVGGNATNGALGALAVNSTGVTSFNAAVKAASLITNAGGSTVLGGGVTTSGT
ncbi:MAG TPA: filamentous hemagglutinin N-terminal domain-containing protein, partial [Rhodanobacter sp.]|nr:filamentous hemagglutinin N-terminal domain-containing protein [Rhodanobacter sp.]